MIGYVRLFNNARKETAGKDRVFISMMRISIDYLKLILEPNAKKL